MRILENLYKLRKRHCSSLQKKKINKKKKVISSKKENTNVRLLISRQFKR